MGWFNHQLVAFGGVLILNWEMKNTLAEHADWFTDGALPVQAYLYLLYIEDSTTQLYGDYNKPL